VHALEQRDGGYKNFPFFQIELEDDPGPVGAGLKTEDKS